MADAASLLTNSDAGHYHRWLQDDAVGLQLWETMDSWDPINSAPEPVRARKWFVGLCLVRLSLSFRMALMKEIQDFRQKPGWWETTGWIAMRMRQVELHPEEYPFSLSPAEWKYYQNSIFGSQVAQIRSFYHPPSFYNALGAEIINDTLDVVGSVIVAIAFVGSDGEAAELLATKRSVVGTALGIAERSVVPGIDPQGPMKRRLWPRYLDEARRRALT